jgi:hypothetical protein
VFSVTEVVAAVTWTGIQHVVDGVSCWANTSARICLVPVRDTVMQYTRKSVALVRPSIVTMVVFAASVELTLFCIRIALVLVGTGKVSD